jgi:hypothetical protein
MTIDLLPGSGAQFDQRTAEDVADWLETAPTAFLMCRRNHRWPKLVARNGKLPRGVGAEPLGRAGSFEMTQKCPDCGTFRVFTYTAGDDLFTASRQYHYRWPDGYKMPKGAYDYITDAMCQQAAMNREDDAMNLAAVLDRWAAELKQSANGGPK